VLRGSSRSLLKEAIHIAQTRRTAGGRQCIEHLPAVAFGVQARVENRHYAAIFARSQQATDPLLEPQYCLGEHIGAKPVLARRFHVCHARFVDRIDLDCLLLAGRYTLLDRGGAALLDACAARGVGVIIGGVFNSGILARVGPDATFEYEPASSAIRGSTR